MLRVSIAFCALHVALGADGNLHNCLKNTGGSCFTASCAAWRGSTTCSTGRCWCTGGTCAGTDEACHPTTHVNVPYSLVESGDANVYEIQNARWPKYFIYVQALGALSTSTDHDGDTSDFSIRKPPSDGGAPGAGNKVKSYMVLSKKWTTSAVFARLRGEENDIVTPMCQEVAGGLGGMLPDPPISTLALTFTKAPADVQLAEMTAKNQTMVMLSTQQFPNHYFYVASGQWAVSTYESDPGAGGYWYIKTLNSVPLPMTIIDDMHTYSGVRCSSFCGKAQAKAHSTSSLSLTAIAAVFMALAVSAASASA